MSGFVIAQPPRATLPVVGTDDLFPVRRIYCVGRNYLAHVREMKEGADERDPPFFFQKPADAIVHDGECAPYPPGTSNLHHEVELVVAIAKGGANISLDAAHGHVYGYAVGVDLTRRDLQTVAKDKGWPWEMGKSFDRSAPIGAVTPAAIAGHGDRRIVLKVNDQTRQDSTTAHMTWSVAEIIAQLSRQYTLAPGDLIMTGTPEGVGAVVAGDLIAAEIDGLAPLSVTIGQGGE